MTAGTTSLDAAGLSATGAGPNPALSRPSPPPRRHGNCFSQWSSLLGIDAFFATARDGLREGQGQTVARPRNPFSRGITTNCRDFWCDPAPIFGKRQSGSAMLAGEVVNYHDMYETPMRMHTGSRSRGGGDAGGGAYRSVADEDPERMV